MGFFKGLEKLSKAVVGTAMLPIDAVREIIPTDDDDDLGDKLARRLKKIGKNLEEAVDEIDE